MRRASCEMTSEYRIMNPVIDVNTDGRCRRSKPRRKSGTGVVAARITLAATPIVPLIRMFHIAHRPSTDSDRPSTSIRSPWPTSGRNTANSTNGTSITRRLATKATVRSASWVSTTSITT